MSFFQRSVTFCLDKPWLHVSCPPPPPVCHSEMFQLKRGSAVPLSCGYHASLYACVVSTGAGSRKNGRHAVRMPSRVISTDHYYTACLRCLRRKKGRACFTQSRGYPRTLSTPHYSSVSALFSAQAREGKWKGILYRPCIFDSHCVQLYVCDVFRRESREGRSEGFYTVACIFDTTTTATTTTTAATTNTNTTTTTTAATTTVTTTIHLV